MVRVARAVGERSREERAREERSREERLREERAREDRPRESDRPLDDGGHEVQTAELAAVSDTSHV